MAAAPILELRGAIPFGISWGFSSVEVFILSVMGSTLPVPILIPTFRHILKWIKNNKYLYKIGNYIDWKLNKKIKGINKKYKLIGLILFVGIPLPSTGAWSGAMIASMLKLSMKEGLIGIFIGNIIAGIIVLNITKLVNIFN